MKTANRLVLALLISFVFCACQETAGGDDDDDDDVSSIGQSAACEGYIECALDVAPETIGDLLETYGPDGSCWESQESADLCTEACEQSVLSLLELYWASEACASAAYESGGTAVGSWIRDTENEDTGEMTIEEDLTGSGALFYTGEDDFSTHYSITGSRFEEAAYRFDMHCSSTDGPFSVEVWHFVMVCDVLLPEASSMDCTGWPDVAPGAVFNWERAD